MKASVQLKIRFDEEYLALAGLKHMAGWVAEELEKPDWQRTCDFEELAVRVIVLARLAEGKLDDP